ncbi:RlpA-like double-psi beta-barrel-protein domain-containing protein-containing protein [Chiua virens]|nr:RlpA-like double-psi beta-barrel-protein domain-containing protein-containing protein [Chiua virens]
MAPLFSLVALFALFSTVIASPHVSRHVYNHAHRAVTHPNIDLDRRDSLPLPKRRRSLNKRCVPRPANATTSAVPTSTNPINVAPVPSLQTSSPPGTSTPLPSSSAPPPTTYQAPSPTSEAPAPTTSDTPAPSPTTSSTPPPAQTSSSSSSGNSGFLSGVQSGQGTFYSTGLGACGITNNDSQNIVAVGWQLFDNYPGANGNSNDNPVCNKNIKVTYQGKSVVVAVTDRCTGCKETDLDMSPNAFDQLADPSVGRINLSWEWA